MDLAQHIGPGTRVVITVDAMAAEIAEASRSLVGKQVILIVYGPDGTPFADEVRPPILWRCRVRWGWGSCANSCGEHSQMWAGRR